MSLKPLFLLQCQLRILRCFLYIVLWSVWLSFRWQRNRLYNVCVCSHNDCFDNTSFPCTTLVDFTISFKRFVDCTCNEEFNCTVPVNTHIVIGQWSCNVVIEIVVQITLSIDLLLLLMYRVDIDYGRSEQNKHLRYRCCT